MRTNTQTSADEIAAPYAGGAEALAEHMLRLNTLLKAAVGRFRRLHGVTPHGGLGGVAVFDEEVDQFLELSPARPARDEDGDEDWAAEDRLRCESRAEASEALRIDLPISALERRFRLSALELDALLHCVALELDPGYGRVFAYLNNDLNRQRPNLGLIVEVLASPWAKRLEARRILGPRSPLFTAGLLTTTRTGGDHLTAELSVDPTVLEFILGGETRPDEAAPLGLDDLLVADAERAAIERTLQVLQRTPGEVFGPTVVVISGQAGAGRRTVAAALCRALGRRLQSRGEGRTGVSLAADSPLWSRDAWLVGDIPGLRVPPASPDEPLRIEPLLEAILPPGCPLAFLFIEADAPPRLNRTGHVHLMDLHLDPPTAGVRRAAWRRALRLYGLECAEEALADVAGVYPFSVGRIHAAAREADLRSRINLPSQRRLGADDLAQVCRGQVRHNLDRLAQALPLRHGWGDIVLPADELSRLREIANAVRNRDRVMEGWGFGEKVSAGPGVNAIFFGPSGTGKTMAASILAGDLGMAIYRVDLSRVVSKYIGETERNLDALFDEAKLSHALLFFDEAEALFGKRSEVKDAHDRYANIEVAYLLQRMETFKGVAVLATNLRKHMDNAFLRRLQFAVEFPLPKAAERLRIWRQVWPAAAALADDLDLEFMATNLELAGGHIRNVALMAAFLAAEEGSPISMKHVLGATRREHQKLGRHCPAEQFGPYAFLLEATT